MRLVHFADTHIGFRAYDRMSKGGMNQREADVADTFAALVEAVIAVKPDAMIVGGDVFHVARPTNAALLHAFTQFSRLRTALPECPIVISAGNHDLWKQWDSTRGADILSLLSSIGVCVANRQAKRFTFDALDLSVLAVPDAPAVKRPALVPSSTRYNVLCLHGEVQGVTQGGTAHHRSEGEVSPDELGLAGWDYVGLGHYHQYERLAPNCVYSGAPDFTSSNPWQEITTPKGFVEHDLESGAHTFHVLAPNRTFVDLPPIEAMELYPDEIMAAIGQAVASIGGVEGKVVRLKVRGVSKSVAAELDTKRIRAWRASAVHFHLVLERPELTVAQQYGAAVPDGAARDAVYDQLCEDAAFYAEVEVPMLAATAWGETDDWPSLAPTVLAGWLSSNPDPYGLDAPERAGVYRLLHG